MYSFLTPLDCVCDVISCLNFSTMTELKPEILKDELSHFSSLTCFQVGVFYYSNRNETRTHDKLLSIIWPLNHVSISEVGCFRIFPACITADVTGSGLNEVRLALAHDPCDLP